MHETGVVPPPVIVEAQSVFDERPHVPTRAVDAHGRVALDLRCARCGYDVRTLPIAGVCTECSTPVADSIHPYILSLSDPTQIRMISVSFVLALASILVYTSSAAIPMFVARLAVPLLDPWEQIELGLLALGGILQIAAAWMVTTRTDIEPRSARTLRRIIRILVPISVTSWIVYRLIFAFATLVPTSLSFEFMMVVYYLIQLGSAVGGACIAWYWRILATRLPSHRLTYWTTVAFIVALAHSALNFACIVALTSGWFQAMEMPVVIALYFFWVAATVFDVGILIALWRGVRIASKRAQHNQLGATFVG